MKVDIDKIEKFVIARYDESLMKKYPLKKYLTIVSIVCSLAVIIFFAIAYVQVSRIERISIYHFYLILALIPLIVMLAIVTSKNQIRKADYTVKPYEAILNKIVAVICTMTLLALTWGLVGQNAVPIVYFVASVVIGLMGVYSAAIILYRLYLIRKYTSYFKDERLRPGGGWKL